MHAHKKHYDNYQNALKLSMVDKYLWIGVTIMSGVALGLFAVWVLR